MRRRALCVVGPRMGVAGENKLAMFLVRMDGKGMAGISMAGLVNAWAMCGWVRHHRDWVAALMAL